MFRGRTEKLTFAYVGPQDGNYVGNDSSLVLLDEDNGSVIFIYGGYGKRSRGKVFKEIWEG